VVTNLPSAFGLDEDEAHKLVERALLGVAGLEQRLELVRSFEAVTGLQSAQVALLEERLDFLWSQLEPNAQQGRLERVVDIAGLPSLKNLPEGTQLDVERLLAIRSSSECHALRRWLREIDRETNEEIAERFRSIRERAAAITHGRTGETVRFLIEAGSGAIPLVGLAVSPALTLADKYLLDKVIGRPGPAMFLSRQYRSLFPD
jgi:hypothetical protein